MAAAAIPLAASALAPEVAGAAGTALAGTALGGLMSSAPWLLPAVTGAGMGGIGSLLTGQNPLRGAALGGVGGGIASQMGGLFNGADAATNSVSGASEAYGPAQAVTSQGALPWVSGASAPTTGGGFFSSGIGKFLPYAAVGALPSLMGNNNSPVGPAMRQPLQSKPVLPGNRTQQSVDPNSYLTNGGNRAFFSDINPQLQYAQGYAKGGSVGLGGGILVNSGNKNPTPYPVIGKKKGVTRYYADGGSSSASGSNIPAMGMINGAGDGQSDSIPAKLSDGEFVISAPVVSALGNGSNDAGAKKLAKMQKGVISRHYSGGKPKKSLGLGSYVN